MYCVRCLMPPDRLNCCNGVILCNLCLDGAGGECHTPGCVMWLSSAPDLPLRRRIIDGAGGVQEWPKRNPVWVEGDSFPVPEISLDRYSEDG